MKKFIILGTLPVMLFMAGCTNHDSNSNLTDTTFDVEVCNQYFELANCIIDNNPDESYTPEIRENLKSTLKETQKNRLEKDSEELEKICSSSLAVFDDSADELAGIGCNLNN